MTNPTGCGTIKKSRGDGNHFRLAGVQVNEVEKNVKNPLTTSTKCAIIIPEAREKSHFKINYRQVQVVKTERN